MNFILRTLLAWEWKRREQQHQKLMDELKNLTAAVDRLSTNAAAIAAKLSAPPGIAPADVQAQTDRVTQVNTALETALTPPAAA